MILKTTDTQLSQSGDGQPALRTASIWHGAILPYLATRLGLVLVGLLADFYILPLLKQNLVLPSHHCHPSRSLDLYIYTGRTCPIPIAVL
jgi:hypothetical protein